MPAAFADEIVENDYDADQDQSATLLESDLADIPAVAGDIDRSDLVISAATRPAVERPLDEPARAMLLLTSLRDEDDAQARSPQSA